MNEPIKDEETNQDIKPTRWPCQDLHGGIMPFINVDDEGECTHEECNPDNLD